MEKQALLAKFMELIVPYFEEKENITLESNLEELGMDSFAAVRFLVDLETEFDIEFPDYLIGPDMFQTVGTIFTSFYDVLKGQTSDSGNAN